MKELQSLGLDVNVLDEDGNEVELLESSEYGNTNLNAIIGNDKDFAFESAESFEAAGFTKQEFNENNEIVDSEVEEEFDMSSFEEDYDADSYDDEN